jgi:hypothetical protein
LNPLDCLTCGYRIYDHGDVHRDVYTYTFYADSGRQLREGSRCHTHWIPPTFLPGLLAKLTLNTWNGEIHRIITGWAPELWKQAPDSPGGFSRPRKKRRSGTARSAGRVSTATR